MPQACPPLLDMPTPVLRSRQSVGTVAGDLGELLEGLGLGQVVVMCCVLRQPSAPVDPPACSGP